MAKDEPDVDFSLDENQELKERIVSAYQSILEVEPDPEADAGAEEKEIEISIVTKELLPELLRRSGYDFDEDMMKVVIDRFYKRNKSMDGTPITEEIFCQFIESIQAPGGNDS